MPRSKLEQFKAPKIIFFWISGAISAVIGGLIAGNSRVELGTTQQDFIISILISGFMFLVTGIFWVLAASEIRDIEENIYD